MIIMISHPDYEKAATMALRLLRDRNVTKTPITPLAFLLNTPHVRLMSFAEFADEAEIERHDLVPMFGKSQDAATFTLAAGMEDVEYVVVYNMLLPHVVLSRAMARELGHIILGHDGETRTTDARRAEAMCFAHHLLSPRPVIHMLRDAGIPVTMNVLARTTGCSEECVDGIQLLPAVRTPRELNAAVRDQFSKEILEYIQFHKASDKPDHSALVVFGSFMDGYEE